MGIVRHPKGLMKYLIPLMGENSWLLDLTYPQRSEDGCSLEWVLPHLKLSLSHILFFDERHVNSSTVYTRLSGTPISGISSLVSKWPVGCRLDECILYMAPSYSFAAPSPAAPGCAFQAIHAKFHFMRRDRPIIDGMKRCKRCLGYKGSGRFDSQHNVEYMSQGHKEASLNLAIRKLTMSISRQTGGESGA